LRRPRKTTRSAPPTCPGSPCPRADASPTSQPNIESLVQLTGYPLRRVRHLRDTADVVPSSGETGAEVVHPRLGCSHLGWIVLAEDQDLHWGRLLTRKELGRTRGLMEILARTQQVADYLQAPKCRSK
jgi:hypothetical protein